MDDNTPDCPRCAELRGKCVKMNAVKAGDIKTCYECPSCDLVYPLQFPDVSVSKLMRN